MRGATIMAVLGLVTAVVAVVVAVPGPADARRRLARPKPPALRPRIVNGALTSGFPSTGLLLAGGDPASASALCSGTLIGCNTFLTAAHCVCDGIGADCQGSGAPDPSANLVFLQHAGFVTIDAVAVHPDYAFPVADVAVVTLGTPLDGVAPTPINETLVAPGLAGTIVGFGRAGGVLQDYGLKRVGNVTTAACTGGISDLTSLCWAFTGVGSNTCNGDSGGPLFLDLGAGPVVAGITSGGDSATCLPNDHSYDVNVAHYAGYIQGVAGADLEATACGALPQAGASGTVVMSAEGMLSSFTTSGTHVFPVTAGTSLLRVTMNAVDDGVGDYDLYVRAGSPPTLDTYDCRQDGPGQYAACEFPSPAAGVWHVLVRRFAGSGAYQLTATTFGGPDATCGNDTWESGEGCDGTDAPACPGGCAADCTCGGTCTPGDLAVARLRVGRGVALRATLQSAVAAYDGMDPRLDPVVLTVGDGASAVVLTIPPNDPGWSRSRPDRGVYRWRGNAGGLRRATFRWLGAAWDVRTSAREVPGASGLDGTSLAATLAIGGACAAGAP